jgi:hypothetical protein
MALGVADTLRTPVKIIYTTLMISYATPPTLVAGLTTFYLALTKDTGFIMRSNRGFLLLLLLLLRVMTRVMYILYLHNVPPFQPGIS